MQLVIQIESIPHITGKKVKDAIFKKTQGDFAYSLATGLSQDKFPKEKDNNYLIVLFNGSEKECKEMETKFWEEGSLNYSDMVKHIEGLRTTRLIKKTMLKIISKSQKFREYINYMKSMMNILVTSHIEKDLTLEELENKYQKT